MEYDDNYKITLKFESNKIVLHRENTSLYTFLGAVAMSHLWIEETEDNGIHHGSRLFWEVLGNSDEKRNETMGIISHAMIQRGYEVHMNIPPEKVDQSDIDAYVAYQMKNFEDN